MGQLVDGVWQDRARDTRHSGGRFIRSETSFRDWVTVDGAPVAEHYWGRRTPKLLVKLLAKCFPGTYGFG